MGIGFCPFSMPNFSVGASPRHLASRTKAKVQACALIPSPTSESRLAPFNWLLVLRLRSRLAPFTGPKCKIQACAIQLLLVLRRRSRLAPFIRSKCKIQACALQSLLVLRPRSRLAPFIRPKWCLSCLFPPFPCFLVHAVVYVCGVRKVCQRHCTLAP